QDLLTLDGLGAEAERRLKALELARADPEVSAGCPERFELSGLDPVLHGAHRDLAPARDFTRRQIPHGDLKMAAISQKSDNSSCSRRDFLTKLIFLADLGLESERGTSGLVPLEFQEVARRSGALAGEALALVGEPVEQRRRRPE